jgi:branched-chain amino acid transport system substrate-binding protein
MTRTSVTTPQLNETFGRWAADHAHVKTVFTIVSNYGPGIDAEQAFQKGFKAAGGKVVGSVRIPVENPDFSSFIRRAKDSGSQAIYIWIPGGSQPAAFGKAMAESGIDPQKMTILGQDSLTYDSALGSMGESALGILTVGNYSPELENKENAAFVKKYVAEFKRHPDIFSIGAYDGMSLIYAALNKTNGKTSGEALIDAAKGMHWNSPRGPVSIDPKTRDIIENVYIRKVEKVGSGPRNVVVDVVHDVKNPVD